MVLLSDYYKGLVCRCNNCGALWGFGPEDVHRNSYVTCQKCGFEILTKMQLDYDGVVKENTNGNGMVSEQIGR